MPDIEFTKLIERIDSGRVPEHVAVIMDGNGRWAKARGLDRSQGHIEGINTVRRTTEIASDLGVKYLTLYTFSTENWNRPKEEVDILMHLIVTAIENETPGMLANNVRLKVIGDMSNMPEATYRRLCQCIDDTAHCTGITMCLAISYSARWDVAQACRVISEDVKNGVIDSADIDADLISGRLTTAGMPDPDLLIRTGGDLRISNFLLWEIAYSELYFTPKYWPDFQKTDFCEAIIDYQSRQRRFGLTGDQITKP